MVPITADNFDTLMRMAAFAHVRRLGEIHDHLTATDLKPGFVFQGEGCNGSMPSNRVYCRPRSQGWALNGPLVAG